MRTDNWKNVERGVAKLFGGTEPVLMGRVDEM